MTSSDHHPSRPCMGRTLADVLQVLRPRIPHSLLGGGGWQRMLACARELPSAAAEYGFAFELRCESPDPAADLCLLTDRGPGCAVASHFVARGEAVDADAAAVALGALFREAQRDGSARSPAVGGITLEFDLAHPLPRGASPGVFVSSPEFRGPPSMGYTDPDRLLAALAAAGCPEHTGNRRAIEAIFAALPPGASVSQGGTFPAREPAIMRLVVAGAENADIPSFLGRAGWPGVSDPAIGVLSDFRDLTPYVGFAFDLHDGRIAPRLGLEMFQPVESGGDAGVWRRFIDRVEERRWCRPDKAKGLRAWLGWEIVFDRTGACTAYRTIHHFKFDLRDGKITVRAYAFVLLRPMVDIDGRADATRAA